jgi:diaminopimelate epimerase
VAASRSGRSWRAVEVALPGGPLRIAWRESDGHILMTGPTALEFTGVLHLGCDAPSVSYERAPLELSF